MLYYWIYFLHAHLLLKVLTRKLNCQFYRGWGSINREKKRIKSLEIPGLNKPINALREMT